MEAPAGSGGGPRERPVRRSIRRQPDRYGALLALVLSDCAVLFTAGRHGIGRWGPLLMVVVTVVFGVRTSRITGPVVVISRIAAGALFVLAIAGAAVGSDWITGWAAIVGGLSLATLSVVILSRVLGHERVTVQTILGAINVYVIFGLVFAFTEFGIETVSGDPFFVQVSPADFADHLYFSFVVLTTLGFGDLTPVTDLGKALVSLEALLGQVFLVTLVARLVSLYD
jgi:Ion channel